MKTFEDYLGNSSSGKKLAWILAFAGILILFMPFFGQPTLASHAAAGATSLFMTAWGFYGVAKAPEGISALRAATEKVEGVVVTAASPGSSSGGAS